MSISLAASFYRELFEKYWTEPCMKRSIIIAGRKTSISIEDAFWKGLREITAAKGIKVTDLVATTWNMADRSGVSFSASKIEAVSAQKATA